MIFKDILSGKIMGKILDVACGSGQFTEVLVKSLASYESITGIDVEEEFLDEAREKFPGTEFHFQVASSQSLPFDDETFDLAAISKALHHVENPARTLTEMKRVVRPGGYILVNEMHRDDLTQSQQSQVMYHHLRSEIDNALGISHNFTFTRSELHRFGSVLDLKDMQILEFTPETASPIADETVSEYSQRMNDWLMSLDGHPMRDQFSERMDDLKLKFSKYGISRPPQMVIMGRK